MRSQTSFADIGRSGLFDGLNAAERQGWIDVARLHECSRGAVIARQGSAATELYLVVAGFLKVVQGTVDGHELIVRFVGPGKPFGGVVALDGAVLYP